MIKKVLSPINIAIFFWGLVLIAMSELYPEYTRYYLYLSILVAVPILVLKLIRVRKEDKINDTDHFRFSMYNVLISAVILGILFFTINKY